MPINIVGGNKHSWGKEELIAYDNASIAEQDERGKLTAAENKGKVEGKMEGKIEAIERCVEEDMIPEIISNIVDLPIAKVNLIIEKIKKRKEGEK